MKWQVRGPYSQATDLARGWQRVGCQPRARLTRPGPLPFFNVQERAATGVPRVRRMASDRALQSCHERHRVCAEHVRDDRYVDGQDALELGELLDALGLVQA